MMNKTNQVLSGLTLLDLTHMLSGPYATMMLSDLGMTTIKVEPLDHGEATRALLAKDPNNSADGMGAYFLTLNRGKKSVCIDLKSPEGLEVFYELVRVADVVVDNFSVGVTQRLGIDYEKLSSINPKIITCSISGFGSTGPDPLRPAFDQVVQAMGGGMSITGLDKNSPMRSGIPIGDLGGGVFGAMGVLAALTQRASTGKGQHVDVSMLDAQISLLNYMATMYFLSGSVPEPIGNSHFVHVPYNSYPTSDGHLIIACIGDAFWGRFIKVLPLEDFLDEKYHQQPVRLAAKAQIDAAIAENLKLQPTAYWLKLFQEAKIPCGPVNRFDQALSDPQVLARNMVIDVKLENGQTVKMPGIPMKFSSSVEETPDAPPKLGVHTDEVLREMCGMSDEQLTSLKVKKIIQ
ncbi:CaiB/BaiF CoA-transferase family protein [Polynucleobacter sp. 30F-ANTBAC]|uniref:CaiB/BaiF CoA transferase family protein n=1 Tax=Polynucleobacter sp. 30F-ANTBAC TaxID=2689095 RepID=UPI002105C693|nr:CoA transferase [Polynucleobacter sp. 30F-ANTBAC]